MTKEKLYKWSDFTKVKEYLQDNPDNILSQYDLEYLQYWQSMYDFGDYEASVLNIHIQGTAEYYQVLKLTNSEYHLFQILNPQDLNPQVKEFKLKTQKAVGKAIFQLIRGDKYDEI